MNIIYDREKKLFYFYFTDKEAEVPKRLNDYLCPTKKKKQKMFVSGGTRTHV